MRLTSALLGLALKGAPDASAAAATVVDHVAREQRLLPAVYLARGGRLRCAALRGYWQARDGLPGRAGIMGRTYRTATEIVVPDVTASADYLEANPGVVAEACFPVLAGGLTVGVLNIESREPLHASDLVYLRECAKALGVRIEQLGGLPSESATQRLLRHIADIAALQDAEAVAGGLLSAALNLVPLGSALLARTTGRDGRLQPSCAAGPLAPVLRDARLESIAAWVQDGISCFTVGQPDAPPAANLAELRAAGVQTLVAVGLFVQGELLGALVLASDEPAVIDTDDVELLEQLATHGAACLRTAELMGSLRERAESDPLTGLGHHATFHEALAGSHRRPTTAVVVCDIDGFKLLNDTYGHGHGDRVLCGVADAMSGALRRGDRLFRVGGDEFAGLLAVESREQALGAAARLRDAVVEARLGVTVSIGVAVPQADESDVALLARADRALYSVKAAGRDGVALADDEPLTAPPALG
jgi:diguanylate cyclase (GGDEF)-like protein